MRRLLVFGSCVLAGTVALLSFSGYFAYQHARKSKTFRVMTRMMAGDEAFLSDTEAARAERALQKDPNDVPTREDLIDYYLTKSGIGDDSEEFEAKREAHILWLIEHEPANEFVGSSIASVSPDQPRYAEVKALWLKQAQAHASDPRVIGNAASALRFEPALSRQLAESGLKLKPNDPRLLGIVADSYISEMRHAAPGAVKTAAAEAAVTALQTYLANEKDGQVRNWKQTDLVISAFHASRFGLAEATAAELLARADDLEKQMKNASGYHEEPDSDAIHAAHTVLGLIALRQNNVPDARKHLLASAPDKGSPVLSSFGPRMVLAREMLERGERETVLAYFQRCSVFWEYHPETLQAWQAEVKAGKIPDFGSNLKF